MDEFVEHIAEILRRSCPTEHEHSYHVAQDIVDGLGLKPETRADDAAAGQPGGAGRLRYVTDWLDA